MKKRRPDPEKVQKYLAFREQERQAESEKERTLFLSIRQLPEVLPAQASAN